jgi:hypothetical protein
MASEEESKMKKILPIIGALLLANAVAIGGAYKAKRFPIGAGKIAPGKFGAGITGSGLSVVRTQATVNGDGSTVLVLEYDNAAGNALFHRVITIPANQASPIIDASGNVINSTVPAGLASAITTFATQLDSTISSAAGAGKLNL